MSLSFVFSPNLIPFGTKFCVRIICCTLTVIHVWTGNLDERVSERALYDILIQAGRVVDLHIPRDKDSDRPKGYAFAEYETPEIADYAVRLFSGLLTLHNRTLKFAVMSLKTNLSSLFLLILFLC